MNPTASLAASRLCYGSPLFEVVSRFVGGSMLGALAAALALGAGKAPMRVVTVWPQHPIADALAMGFLMAVCLSPVIILFARHRAAEQQRQVQVAVDQGREVELPRSIWTRVGRRSALAAFAVTFAWLWFNGFDSIGLSPLGRWG